LARANKPQHCKERKRAIKIPAMANLTKADNAQARAYGKAKPKELGNLHERMKYAVALADAAYEKGGGKFDQEHPYLRMAIYDLQTEVQYYEPAKPPFGRRSQG
jgi:hypothetical protein